jgi:hypothetical protein
MKKTAPEAEKPLLVRAAGQLDPDFSGTYMRGKIGLGL